MVLKSPSDRKSKTDTTPTSLPVHGKNSSKKIVNVTTEYKILASHRPILNQFPLMSNQNSNSSRVIITLISNGSNR